MNALLLPKSITHDNAVDCLSALTKDIHSAQGNEVVINAAALEKFDSSAIAVLLKVKRETQASNKRLTITNFPQQLADLVKVYGLHEVLAN